MTTIILLVVMVFLSPVLAHASPPVHPKQMNCQQVLKWSTDSYMNIFKSEKVPAPMSREAVETKFKSFLESRPDSPCYKHSKSSLCF